MKGFRKYFVVLLITVGIFAIAYFASVYFNNQKIAEIQKAQDQATVDVLSSETQFDLLESQSCQDVTNTYLSQEISNLADKISYAEQNFSDQTQLNLLKQQYAILEVKDYLLTKQISERCKSNIVTILYFYENANSCTDCQKQGYVLDAIRQNYPQARVYSFDAGLDSSTIRALLSINKISDKTLPAVVVDGTTYTGFQSLDTLTAMLPTTTPSTTASTPKKTITKKTQ